MRSQNLSNAEWRKSSYSSGEGANGNCVEAAVSSDVVGVRDTKSPERGAILLDHACWQAFLHRICD